MTEVAHMRRAIELARSAVGRTDPNPPVGAVLVKDGRVFGEGATQPPGQAHAEIVALRQAGAAAKGADLYVTLEPCPHWGRTPPCAQALIDAGVSSVHIAALDPNPATARGGVAALEAAGVHVTIHDGPPEARQLIEAFAKHVTTGLPFVTAKFAISLDGKIATHTGDSRWISGEASRRAAHRLRAEASAVMVGIGTALADDPLLTVRDVAVARPQPMRVVVDSRGRLPETAAMLAQDGTTLLAVANVDDAKRATLESRGVEVMATPGADGRVDLLRAPPPSRRPRRHGVAGRGRQRSARRPLRLGLGRQGRGLRGAGHHRRRGSAWGGRRSRGSNDRRDVAADRGYATKRWTAT